VALGCPVVLTGGDDEPLASAKTLNVSDGGALVPIPPEEVPACGTEVSIRLSVPRSTPNTHMLEEFSCRGRILRHQPLASDRLAGVAMQFVKPQELSLEV